MASLDLRLTSPTLTVWMSTSSRNLFFAGLMLACVSSRGVASLDELVKDSPFLPKPTGTEAGLVSADNAAVEFRGMIATKDEVLFGLYDRTKQIGAWVGKEQKGADFMVHAFDPGSDTVSFEYQGQKFNLTLASSKVSMAVPTGTLQLPSQPGVNPVVVTALPSGDQGRLEAIASEVRRRRALRQGAASQAAPAVAK